MNDLATMFGWNAYAGRVYHDLTGGRGSTGRPVTACGFTARGGAGPVPPVGYVLCSACQRARARRTS